MASSITAGDTYRSLMFVEVRSDSRLSSSSLESELSVELNNSLHLLENKLAMLSEPKTLSTTGDGDVFCYQKSVHFRPGIMVRVLEQCFGQFWCLIWSCLLFTRRTAYLYLRWQCFLIWNRTPAVGKPKSSHNLCHHWLACNSGLTNKQCGDVCQGVCRGLNYLQQLWDNQRADHIELYRYSVIVLQHNFKAQAHIKSVAIQLDALL